VLGSAAGTDARLNSRKFKKNMKRIVAAAMIQTKIGKRKKNKRNSMKWSINKETLMFLFNHTIKETLMYLYNHTIKETLMYLFNHIINK